WARNETAASSRPARIAVLRRPGIWSDIGEAVTGECLIFLYVALVVYPFDAGIGAARLFGAFVFDRLVLSATIAADPTPAVSAAAPPSPVSAFGWLGRGIATPPTSATIAAFRRFARGRGIASATATAFAVATTTTFAAAVDFHIVIDGIRNDHSDRGIQNVA